MKFILNKEDRKELNKLIEAKNINIAIADMLLTASQYECITDANELKKVKNIKEAYLESLYDFLELDMDNKENIELANAYIKPAIDLLKSDEYETNPYFKAIKVENNKLDKYSLSIEKYRPYQLFSYDDIEVKDDDYYHEISKMGLFNHPYHFISLLEKDIIWMCITPNEMNTMKKAIDKAKGNVITFGLGLGYFTYMSALKNDVTSLTVIEKDKTVISLFKKFILPQFKCKNKIHIIEDDAFNYLNSKEMNKYDFAFVDLWHNPEDGLPLYIRFKAKENNYPNCHFEYWLEKGILAMYRRCFLTVIEEQLNGLDESNYKNFENELDKIVNKIYYDNKNVTYQSYKEIYNLCKDEEIKKIMKSN